MRNLGGENEGTRGQDEAKGEPCARGDLARRVDERALHAQDADARGDVTGAHAIHLDVTGVRDALRFPLVHRSSAYLIEYDVSADHGEHRPTLERPAAERRVASLGRKPIGIDRL